MKANSQIYFYALTSLLALFILRVAGQISVAFFNNSFLPPMQYWQSGLLPYPLLLLSQMLIIGLFFKVCLDFKKGEGLLFEPNARLGKFLITFASLYISAMMIRFVIQGWSIPVVFHWILATFLFIWGSHHTFRMETKSDTVTI